MMCDRWALYNAMKKGIHVKSYENIEAVQRMIDTMEEENVSELVAGMRDFYMTMWADNRIRI